MNEKRKILELTESEKFQADGITSLFIDIYLLNSFNPLQVPVRILERRNGRSKSGKFRSIFLTNELSTFIAVRKTI